MISILGTMIENPLPFFHEVRTAKYDEIIWGQFSGGSEVILHIPKGTHSQRISMDVMEFREPNGQAYRIKTKALSQ